MGTEAGGSELMSFMSESRHKISTAMPVGAGGSAKHDPGAGMKSEVNVVYERGI
jgi:hypothetical protein